MTLVLIVDDDESVRESVLNLLGSVGMTVAAFASAEELLASSELQATKCLIVDYQLSGVSGIELMKRIPRAIRTILLTAHDDPHLRERARNAGALAYLSKPFNADDLIDLVRTALAE